MRILGSIVMSVAVAFGLMALAPAQVEADSQVVYSRAEAMRISYNSGPVEVVTGRTQFPGYGPVPSSKVCFDPASETFHAHVEAETFSVCREYEYDYSDSTHPKKYCVREETIHREAEDLTAPLYYDIYDCVDWDVDYSDSTRPRKTCLRKDTVTVRQSLKYSVVIYKYSDYMRRNGRRMYRPIPNCSDKY